MVNQDVKDAVMDFGKQCALKLSGPGEAEAAIRGPVDALLQKMGSLAQLAVVMHDEVPRSDLSVRPDFAIRVNGVISGYVEVKAPGTSLDPATFSKRNKLQFERLSELPNVLYTNGLEWRLYRTGALVHSPQFLIGDDLHRGYAALFPRSDTFELVVTDFLKWKPDTIKRVTQLVSAVAPLTRLLRHEVVDRLKVERKLAKSDPEADMPFLGMSKDWKKLLFPDANDDVFADGYAQTVTFALLLAKTEGIDLIATGLHEIGQQLGNHHSLMAKALQLLTDNITEDFRVTVDLLVRTISAVQWEAVRAGSADTYMHLYEHFIQVYDADLRKKSGTYYTPAGVVEDMVRLTEEVLSSRLGLPDLWREPSLSVIDPAMGTGTYPVAIMESAARHATKDLGMGAAPEALKNLVKRLYGFEIQTGPFSVAELRMTEVLKKYGAGVPANGMNLFLTDTLEEALGDENEEFTYSVQQIAHQRKRANIVKKKRNVTVVIGNPPYKSEASGLGGWIENGVSKSGAAPLDDFKGPGNVGRFLKNLHVYFWRWAAWKVFESTAAADTEGDDTGVICFISPSGFIRGPQFNGMREYLRRTSSEGWIIDLNPEGRRAKNGTNVFDGVDIPIAISIFVREPGTPQDQEAEIHYTSLGGTREEKLGGLRAVSLDSGAWETVRTGWGTPLLPTSSGGWETYPALSDLMPWYSPGVSPNRRWVYAPAETLLEDRFRSVVLATGDEKAELFKESRDAHLRKPKEPLPGSDTDPYSATPFINHTHLEPFTVRAGLRSLDRQYLIADSRLLHDPRRDLWRARVDQQVFVVEQNAKAISSGIPLVFSPLIPSGDYFDGRGGRTFPYLHATGRSNLAPGLEKALSSALGMDITASTLLAYIAGVASHSGFTETFASELTTPGVRVPITTSMDLWKKAVDLGERIIWLQTYGERFQSEAKGRGESVRKSSSVTHEVKYLSTVQGLPGDSQISFNESQGILYVGEGAWGPISAEARAFSVGNLNVLDSWLGYRSADAARRTTTAKTSSPLDYQTVDVWQPEWSQELTELLTVLEELVLLGDEQGSLLEDILEDGLLTSDDLRVNGVVWPKSRTDRRAETSIQTSSSPGTFTIEY